MRIVPAYTLANSVRDLRLAGIAIAGCVLLALIAFGALPAQAGKTGVVARAGTLRLAGSASPSSQLVFSNGAVVDLSPISQWVNTNVHDDSAIVIYEPAAGTPLEGGADAADIEIRSLDIGSAATLGELLDEAGAVVRFESASPSSADPFLAERFEAVYPDAHHSSFVAGPFRSANVPEPGIGLGLATGLLAMAGLITRGSGSPCGRIRRIDQSPDSIPLGSSSASIFAKTS